MKAVDASFARMEIQGKPYILLNCYVPNSEKGQVKTFTEISNHLADMDITPDYKFICVGDWNLIFDATRHSFGGTEIPKLKAMKKACEGK